MPKLSDEEIARRCVNCSQGKWVPGGRHECKRNVCKYRSYNTSIYFKDKGGKQCH